MDETDNAVKPKFVQDNWYYFQSVIDWAFEQNPGAIKFYPNNLITHSMIINAIKYDRNLLDHIPDYLIDRKVIDYILSQPNPNLEGLPTNLLTNQDCERLFGLDYSNIRWIPKELQTQEMCFKTLEEKLEYIEYVNTDFLNLEFVISLLEKIKEKNSDIDNYHYVFCINLFYQNLPEIFKNDRVNNLFSSVLPRIIENFKSEDITEKMAWRVIKHNDRFISAIPASVWNKEMVAYMVENLTEAIQFIPAEYLDSDMIHHALNSIKHESSDWNWIPQKFRDEQMLSSIFKRSEYTKYRWVETIQADTWTQGTADMAFKENQYFLTHIPQKFMREEWVDQENQPGKQGKKITWKTLSDSIKKNLDQDSNVWSTAMSAVNNARAQQYSEAILNVLTQLDFTGLPNNEMKEVKQKWHENCLDNLRSESSDKSFKL